MAKSTPGNRIRETRERLGVTQSELARILNCEPSAVCMWENGDRGVTINKLQQIANALSVDVVELVVGNSGASGKYLRDYVRCQECGEPMETEGSHVKDRWKYWHLDCWKQTLRADA